MGGRRHGADQQCMTSSAQTATSAADSQAELERRLEAHLLIARAVRRR